MQHRMGLVADNKCRDLEMFAASLLGFHGNGWDREKARKKSRTLGSILVSKSFHRSVHVLAIRDVSFINIPYLPTSIMLA